jgi:hypothetical protein
LKTLPKIQFELPVENDQFLKEASQMIDELKNPLDLCYHRVVSKLNKKCKDISMEELGKLAVLLMNCQLENEGRETYSCKPEMSLKQCTIQFDQHIYEIYTLMNHRAVAICSAIKHQQFKAMTEMTIDRLVQVSQSQASVLNEALQKARRINELSLQNIEEFREGQDKIKEAQILNIEALANTKEQIHEISLDLQRQIEIHRNSQVKLFDIEKSTDQLSRKIDDVMRYLDGIVNIISIISNIISSIEGGFGKVAELTSEIGIEITQEFFMCTLVNIFYFTCGMIFIIFMNIRPKYKYVLILLFIFNTIAAFHNSEVPLIAFNVFVWISCLGFMFADKLKEKIELCSLEFNFLKFTRCNRNINTTDDEIEKRRSLSRARSKTPLGNIKVNSSAKPSDNITNINEEEDTEMVEIYAQEQQLVKNQQQQQLQASTSFVRAETPLGRPMTPAMMRVMQTERAGTPWQSNMQGRVQCNSTTTKGLQCRNASIEGQLHCRVHSYNNSK